MNALRAAVRAWGARNVIADDPAPQYSVLDVESGLGARPSISERVS